MAWSFFLSNTLMLALVWIVVGSEGFLASVLASMYSIYPKHPCDWSIWVGNRQHQKDNMYEVVVWRVGLISLLVYVIWGFKSRTMDIFNFQVIYKFYWQFNFGEKKSQSIVYLLSVIEHIYRILGLEVEVQSIGVLWTRRSSWQEELAFLKVEWGGHHFSIQKMCICLGVSLLIWMCMSTLWEKKGSTKKLKKQILKIIMLKRTY